MSEYTKDAVEWASKQTIIDEFGITLHVKDSNFLLVNKVREYYNDRDVQYENFSYNGLRPYIVI